MISYNKGGNIILSKGLPRVPMVDIDEFKDQSFMKFCTESAPRIIKEYYEPAFNNLVKTANVRVEIVDIAVDEGIKISIDHCHQRSSQEAVRANNICKPYTIYGRFQLYPLQGKSSVDYTELNKVAEMVELGSIPYVEDGLVVYDRYDQQDKVYKKHAYNFIPQIELAPSISKGLKNEVTIRCASGKSLVFYIDGKGRLQVRLDKKKHIPFAAIVANRLMSECRNMKPAPISAAEAREFVKQIPSIVHYYGLLRNDDQPYFEGFGSYSSTVDASGKEIKRIDSTDFMKKVMPLFVGEDACFTTKELRGALNEYLSLYRAVGCISSKDVRSQSGELILSRGDVITTSAVDELYKNDIYVVHVMQETPVSVFLEKPIWVNFIPKGTKNHAFLRSRFPEETGLYISRDYILKGNEVVAFVKNTEISKELWQFLREVNYPYAISVKPSIASSKVYDLYLDREIVSNYCKPAGNSYEDWVYVGPLRKGSDGTDAFTFGDMFALYTFIPQVLNNLFPGWLPNADACFLKKLTTVDDMFSRALQETSTNFFKYSQQYVAHFKRNVTDVTRNDTFANRMFTFYHMFMRKLKDMKCVEMVDSKVFVNPLAYESAKHKANIYVGNKHAIADDQRKMALNSYGRFDPYEVPQSGRLGIVNQLTTTCKLTDDGIPLVAYYPVENMQVRFDKLTWLNAQQESKTVIADIGSLQLAGNKILNDPYDIVNCRVPSSSSAKSNIEPQPICSVKYVNADPNCTLGFTCGSIPFSDSNDAIRATFAVAQIKEAKPTVNNEPAGITTTIMSQFEKKNNPFSLRAKHDGVICQLSTTPCATRTYKLDFLQANRDGGNNRRSYCGWTDLGGSESLSRLKLVYPVGKAFHKGDMLMKSQFVNDKGEICMGMDVLVGYISDGYNYEDGVSIMPAFSERATSISIHEEDIYEGKHRPRFIPEENRYYHKDDTLFVSLDGKTTPYKHVLTVAGYHYDTEVTRYEDRWKMTMKFLSYEPAHIGDKFSDRDGNKGVCTHIYGGAENYTLANGYPLEVLRNPLGVATRLNIGQLKECRLSWARKILGPRIEIDSFSHDDEDTDTLVKLAYNLANMSSADEAIAPLRDKLPKDLIELAYEKFEEAQAWRGVFDEDGACNIYFNGIKRPTKAYVGFIHMLKLVQEVRSKIAYRAGTAEDEQYMSRSNAPTKGRKHSGGQRLGSMEVAAYCAYGADEWLKELFGARADDGLGRVAFAVDKYFGDKSYYNDVSQRRAVTELVVSLAAMGIDISGTDGELIDMLGLQTHNYDYPKFNTIRSEMSFGRFNKPRRERKQLQEDVVDTDLYSEDEMINWSVLWDFFGWDRLHDPNDKEAQDMLCVCLPTEAEREKFFKTIEKRGLKR